VLLGAAGQFGIFLTLIAALLLGFTRPEAASIGIIGAIDGPTSIYVSGLLAPHLLGPITVAAYSYMSLVPIILPPIMKLLTTKQERLIRMPYSQRQISRRTRILFPIVVTVVVGTLVLLGSVLLFSLHITVEPKRLVLQIPFLWRRSWPLSQFVEIQDDALIPIIVFAGNRRITVLPLYSGVAGFLDHLRAFHAELVDRGRERA